MKAPLISTSLLSVLCISIVGCHKEAKVTTTPPPLPNQIRITACVAVPDTLAVKDNQPVSFLADVDYQVTFLPKITPNGPAVPVSPNPFVVRGSIAVPKTIHGPSNCGEPGCLYKYSLAHMKNGLPQLPPCADPGIRILP